MQLTVPADAPLSDSLVVWWWLGTSDYTARSADGQTTDPARRAESLSDDLGEAPGGAAEPGAAERPRRVLLLPAHRPLPLVSGEWPRALR